MPYTNAIVAVDEAKVHLNIFSNSDDQLIEALCIASTEFIENYCQRVLLGEDGYGYREDVPETLKVCAKLLIGEWYLNRELSTSPQHFECPLGIARLLAPYRKTEFN